MAAILSTLDRRVKSRADQWDVARERLRIPRTDACGRPPRALPYASVVRNEASTSGGAPHGTNARRWLIVGVLVGLVGIGVLDRFGSIDPTEQVFPVMLANDTRGLVDVQQCDTDCGTVHDQFTLAPGEAREVGASDRPEVTQWYRVSGPGLPSGCVPLTFDGRHSGTVVSVRPTATCP
jgi:hypothetical protein